MRRDQDGMLYEKREIETGGKDMKREMYKKDRQLPEEQARAIFEKGHHGILSVNGDDGYPYGVPVNYVYLNDCIYIHSAKYGYKIEALENNRKVCFTAILSSEILPSKFTAALSPSERLLLWRMTRKSRKLWKPLWTGSHRSSKKTGESLLPRPLRKQRL